MSVTPESAQSPDVSQTPGESPRALLAANASNELVFAVVGHAGSGTSTVAKVLQELLTSPSLGYDVVMIRARDVIVDWAQRNEKQLPVADTLKLKGVEILQDRGDEMRALTPDYSSVARAMIAKIRMARAQRRGVSLPQEGPVEPDGKRRAYILDSIRHPSEVEILRHVYQDAFILIGVVCEEEERIRRLIEKYPDAGSLSVKQFMRRDAKAPPPNGQRVAEAFHLADYFLDNTTKRFMPDESSNPDWNINDKLNRLIRILSHTVIVRPETSETAMSQAANAAMRSACLSRQVGAALTDRFGNLVATGSNEVPSAGGGVYGEAYSGGGDHRCAFRAMAPGKIPYCSNTTEQNAIVEKLFEEIAELKAADGMRKLALREELKRSGIGDLIEFSRAVHAEMDAMLSAGRCGHSTVGGRLYVTTFPCHYCARHIVSAGIDEVQFIEPYPKSRALGLHGDAITQEVAEWMPPSEGGKHVLFRPFVGVAPRLYKRAFNKDRELKNKQNGEMLLQQPPWGDAWHLRTVGYVELEAKLSKNL